jgi:hypothetical protein
MNDSHQFIAALSPDDALQVLKLLAQEDDALAERIVQIASQQLEQVDPEGVAEDVLGDLAGLEVEEVWDRAGKTRHGYVDPGEAAYDMVGEVIEPYIDELRKYFALGMKVQARLQCMGLLLGLYEFETNATSEFKDWAPGFEREFAERVLTAWKDGLPTQADRSALKEFLRDEGITWNLG